MAKADAEPTSEPLHFAVVGGGVAGCAAASWAASHGARVTLFNAGLPLGGTCIHAGAFPTRLLMTAATDHFHAQHPRFSGLHTAAADADWEQLQKVRMRSSEDFSHLYQRLFAERPNIEVVDRAATFVDGDSLRAGERLFYPDRILLTPGSHSQWPDIDGIDDVTAHSLQTLNELGRQPKSVLLLETSDVAIAYAQFLARIGTDVTILTERSRLLGEAHCLDIDSELTRILGDEGVDLVTDIAVTHAEQLHGQVRLLGTQAGHPAHWDAECFVVVDHRRPRIEGLKPHLGNVELSDEGFIVIDESMQTTNERVFAAGDAIGRGRHAYAAAYDAILAARNAVYPSRTAGHHTAVPFAIYTDPQFAGVGWNELRARRAGFQADTAVFSLSELPAAHALGSTRGFIKLVRDRRSDHLMGARILAPNASELIMELTLAVRYGLTVTELAELVHPPISLGEAIGRAARAFSSQSQREQQPRPQRGSR